MPHEDWQRTVLGDLDGTAEPGRPGAPGRHQRHPPDLGQQPESDARADAGVVEPAPSWFAPAQPPSAQPPPAPAPSTPAPSTPAASAPAASAPDAAAPAGQPRAWQPPARPPEQRAEYRPAQQPVYRPAYRPAPLPDDPPPGPPDAPVRRRPPHGDPMPRRVGRSVRRVLGSSAAGDVERASAVARHIQQPITTGRRIAVTSIRGGVGKTTVAALLGVAFAHYRHDRVLVLESDLGLGTLPVRMGVRAGRSLVDLVHGATASASFPELETYLTRLAGGMWLLPGSCGQVGARLDPAAYRAAAVALSRFFAVTVVDCDTLPGEMARVTLADSHARVIVTSPTVEGVLTTRTVLDWLAAFRRPELLAGTVVVLMATTPHVVVDVARVSAELAARGASVVAMSYDRHLAAGGPMDLTRLAAGTRDTAALLAAELLSRAMRG